MFKVTCISLILCCVGVAADKVGPTSYLRRGIGGAGRMEIRTAIRTFEPISGKGPKVLLVGVSHVGDSRYYADVQKRLNACDLVLYEGVGRPLFMTETAKATTDPMGWTRSALTYLRDVVVWYRQEIGAMPDDFRKLRLAVKLHNRRELAWVDRVRTDAWGNLVTIQISAADACMIGSCGSDGKLGGTGGAADLMVAVTATTRRSDAGSLQKQLAESLGLTFQLDVIDYSKPTFVNSDLGVAKLRQLMSGNTAAQVATTGNDTPARSAKKPKNELETLINQLQGGDPVVMMAMSLFKGVLTRSEKGRELVKWILGEALVNAESMMEELGNSTSESFAGTAKMMRILIHDRNVVVMADLTRYLKDKPALTSIAVFYGAAHMKDLELQVTKELGYVVKTTDWLTAFAADRKKAGITAEQARSIRQAIKKQMNSIK